MIIALLYIVLIVVSIINVLMNGELTSAMGYYEGSDMITRVLYMFCHANIFHLIVNLYAIYKVRELSEVLIEKRIGIKHMSNIVLVIAFAIGFLATFGSEGVLPTVGISGVISAYLGIVTVSLWNKYSWTFLITTLIFNLIAYFIGNSNVMVHSLSFIYGCVLGFLILIYGLERDKRYKR